MRQHMILWNRGIGTAILMVVAATGALAQREHTDPTAWWWMRDASEAGLNEQADAGYRLFDIEVESTNPYRFTGVFVRNAGIHSSTWWWRYNRTEAQIESLLAQENARIIDLEVVRVNNQPRLAATMIRNTGANAAAWWWYYDKSFAFIEARVAEHNARIIDLDTYAVNGTRLWSAVMVRNTGNQFRNWWWYSNLTSQGIQDRLKQHNARIVDIERRPSGRYAVVLQEREGEAWWYWLSANRDQLIELYRQRKTRIIDLEEFQSGNEQRFTAVVIDNANELERSMRQLMLGQTDGAYGFYLKRVAGPVLAETFGTRPFYPASTIKVLQHLYTMAVFGQADPSIPRWPNHTSDIQVAPPFPPFEPLSTMQTLMMVPSNNQRTNNLQDFFGRVQVGQVFLYFGVIGRNVMNNYGWNTVGMSTSTALNHKMGTNGPDGNNPANTATLEDLGKLYERVALGELLSAVDRQTFMSRMLWNQGPNNTHSLFSAIGTVITQEAIDLGVSSASLQTFNLNVHIIFKPGSLNVSQSYASNSGWISIPFRTATNRLALRQYVFGVFADAYTTVNFNINASASPQATGELLRKEIRSALQTFL